MSSPSAPFPRWSWVLFALLYGALIPWWWPEGDATIAFGLPRWVVTALCGGVLVAVTVNVLIHRYWHEDAAADEEESTP